MRCAGSNVSLYTRPDTPFDETFDAIWEAHVQQLMPCDLCGRTFFPDRIGVHKRWCKGEKPLKVRSVQQESVCTVLIFVLVWSVLFIRAFFMYDAAQVATTFFHTLRY